MLKIIQEQYTVKEKDTHIHTYIHTYMYIFINKMNHVINYSMLFHM